MHVRWNTGLDIFRGKEVKKKIELNQIKRQTEILSTFMPDKILNMNKAELREARSFVGVLLFVDVSGFTPLCEKYNKTGKGGIYRLTATLNAYIGALVEVIYFFGGDVLKFSGDAFLALWVAPPDVCLFEVIHEVIVCSLFIQETLGCFRTEVNVLLKVKIAISCGNLTFSVIGNKEYRHYVIIGQAVNDVKDAERVSVSGDVVISQSAWGHLSEESYEALITDSGNVKIRGCIYAPTQHSLKEHYSKKCEIAQDLCEKHIEHRNSIHEMKKIDDATTDSKLTECFIAALPQRLAVENSPLTWIPSDLNPFIVRPVQSQIEEKQPIEYLTEMREVTIQFINIIPESYEDLRLITMINKAFQIVCKGVSKVKGVVNKLSLFDKDAMMLVLFGLRGVKHELESQNALKSAFGLRKELRELDNVKSVSIGITNGLVYCGVVGHPFRREYTVIGGPVNKAARIMCAYENKVTCDHITYKSCKLSSLYFQLQSALKLKGIDDAGHIFEYNENFSKTSPQRHEFGKLIGREMEQEFLTQLIEDPENVGWYGICFRGDPKVGKTKILRYVLMKYTPHNKYIATVSLNAVSQRPYFCVAALYKQLHDILLGENYSKLKNLPTDLWDLNEIFQKQSASIFESPEPMTSDRSTILANFIDICAIPKRNPIFLVDNINYIDSKSLNILDTALRKKKFRLICAGSFEDQISWNTMWNISLSNQIKLFTLEPLSSVHLLPLVCKFLHVEGVAKKLLIVIDRICEGKPGWIETCLLKMINNEELEVKYWNNEEDYVFLEAHKEAEVALVASFSRKYIECTEDITLAAISLDLFDSFSPHQQLIIKTAAVLGEIFSRTTLMILLKYPNEAMLASAIKTLFEEDVFDCASRYVSSGGLQDKKYKCLCYIEDEEYDTTLDNFPKYAFCRLLHFKNKNIRILAYELLPNNQKKELHLRITDLLENQVNACPNCLRDNSAVLIKLTKFNDLLAICTDPQYFKKLQDIEMGVTIETYKEIIRDVVKNKNANKSQTNIQIPKRKLWDPSVCFCVEILFKVYRDLIYHSHYGEHIGKKIFFMVQYSLILVYMNELDDVIPILEEASEICLAFSESYLLTGNFKFKMFCKIHAVLGYGFLKRGEISAAKNHAIIALRRFNIPLISFQYTYLQCFVSGTSFMKSGRTFDQKTRLEQLSNLDLGYCIGLLSAIYAAEGKWDLAKATIKRSICSLEIINPNISIFCDIYTKAIELYTFCGDLHTCEKLERCINSQLLKFYGKNDTCEMHLLSKLFSVLFYMNALNGNIAHSIRMGYRILSLDITLHAIYRLLETIPILAYLLRLVQRIEEAVYIARIAFNIGIKYHAQGFVCYFAFCIQLILETSFYVERISDIEEYAKHHFLNYERHSKSGILLIAGLYNYYLRHPSSSTDYWKQLYHSNKSTEHRAASFTTVLILIRYVECALLELVRNLESPEKSSYMTEAKAFLSKLEVAAQKFNIFMPRYLHYKAYYYRIKNKIGASKQFLKKANKAASSMNNVLEQCWTELHSTYWYGDYTFERPNIGVIKWKLAKSYSPLQWCYVLSVLPFD